MAKKYNRKVKATKQAMASFTENMGLEKMGLSTYKQLATFIGDVKEKIGYRYIDGGKTIDDIIDLFNMAVDYNLSLDALAKNFEYYNAHKEKFKGALDKGKVDIIKSKNAVAPSKYFKQLGMESIKQWKASEAKKMYKQKRRGRRK